MSSEFDCLQTKLSICIATYKRAAYIGATLEAMLNGLPDLVEVVIVDGASPDNTRDIVDSFTRRSPAIRYIREASNAGVDSDFDKAVAYARGEYCWLMSDDDILVPGAVAHVLALLEATLDLIVVNAQIRSADLSVELSPRILEIDEDRFYDADSANCFLSDTGSYLSFIGGVVIRRALWLARERKSYYGSLFIHVGVIFQAPLRRVRVIASPLVTIRYGNAMWTSRGFEIWMFKWPDLIWSFSSFSNAAKQKVVPREPWRSWKRLTHYRGIGAYSRVDYVQYFKQLDRGGLLQWWIAALPASMANTMTAVFWYVANRGAKTGLYDLVRSANASWLTRLVTRRLNILP